MKKHIYLILSLFAFCGWTQNAGAQLPDSIITIEHTYYYIVSDPEKAQQIMDELKLRKTDKDWELDWCQADLYYNTGKYRLACYYFEKVAGNAEVNNNPELYMGLLSTQMECYRMNNNTQQALKTAAKVIEIAKELDNDAEIGRAYMFMGIVSFRQQNEKLAHEYLESARQYLEKSGNNEYIYHFNLSVADLMCEEAQYEEAYGYTQKAESTLKRMAANSENLLMPQGQIEYEEGRLCALTAEILARSGRKEEASRYYAKFTSSPCIDDSRSKIYIVPYLLATGNYSPAISISQERIDILRAGTDTVGQDMFAALNYLTEAYRCAGDKEMALKKAQKAIDLSMKIRAKERENDALEFVTIYNVQEKESRIAQQEKDLQKRNILLYCSTVTIILSLIIVIIVAKNMKRIKEKNLSMVRQIKEMQLYRQNLEKKNKESLTKKLSDKIENRKSEKDILSIFTLIDRKLKEEKLYLNPDLTRDDLIDLLPVNRLDFIQAVNEYSGMNFTDYVNGLRLEVAIGLLEMPAKEKMEVIAEKSGFGSVRSFYRQFKNKYNMSPMEYRELAK